jgi:peptidase E
MVRVHRYLLQQIPPPVKAVFIDTPAGFQMNADDLFEKARDYFKKHFNQPLEQVSFKSSKAISPYEAEKAFQTLRQADYIFVGPGSPTYALRNWFETSIPDIIFDRIQSGACFVAASAAALTLGRFTLPVYEIYKVGEEPHWVEGLDLLGRFGLHFVVIPHWNNAEGGTHDTRFCYMGEPRLLQLEGLLPSEIPILGVDEHTACILDFKTGQALVRGVGGITLHHGQIERTFQNGESLPLEELEGFVMTPAEKKPVFVEAPTIQPTRESFMDQIRASKESFDQFLQEHQGTALIDLLVGVDQMIWKSYKEVDNEDQISDARETLREMIVQLGLRFDETPKDIPSILSPLMDILLEVRDRLRTSKEWEMADRMRVQLL